MKEERKIKKEKKRQLEEERKKREEEKKLQEEEQLTSLLPGVPASRPRAVSPARAMASQALLRQSAPNVTSVKKDYENKRQTMLGCLRKLFNEARTCNVDELNGEQLFNNEAKNLDGSVSKDTVLSTLLTNEQFSLTRLEVSSMLDLMLDINRDD